MVLLYRFININVIHSNSGVNQLPEEGYFPFVPLMFIFTLISMVFPSLSGFTLKNLDALDAPISILSPLGIVPPIHKKL